jgi:peptidoglycan/xylan/chitin deacetylase (PgdA/CDA1 family)
MDASVRRSGAQMFARLRRKLLRPVYKLAENAVSASLREAVVSFSFDDFPISAGTAGAGILADHGARGTFYVAGSLVGTSSHQYGGFCRRDDLAALIAAGHEIGCHTYGHARVSTLSPRGLIEELDRNAAFVGRHLGGYAMRSFAYPFGDISPLRKLQVQTRFASCRGNAPGINAGRIDLGDLRAERIYEQSIDHDRIAALLRSAASKPAWLIFYTHDVAENPSPYGCTPATFERVVQAVADAGIRILTVADAAALVTGAQGSAPPAA